MLKFKFCSIGFCISNRISEGAKAADHTLSKNCRLKGSKWGGRTLPGNLMVWERKEQV